MAKDKDKTKDCLHVKMYDENAILRDPTAFKWTCGKCAAKGIGDDKIEFIYAYDHITALRRKWDPDYED